ncbi:hypothetical protein MUB24_14230 [Lederbergia sp. NSJ-179]|uniref:DUF6886 family protein n=1 Tax=Lederbergia sp. NSJ-179 TaxID=2931402 RepID=UPI001FD0ED87|nr:DUF6886 family protein [Lederbergia sp. NSJ-179]MCJ7842038.1 hypothetical protein [Lederbergia sp. NSJ-179]
MRLFHMSETSHVPLHKWIVSDLFAELFKRNVELRLVDNLWEMGEKVQTTTFYWSLCRMRFAQPK